MWKYLTLPAYDPANDGEFPLEDEVTAAVNELRSEFKRKAEEERRELTKAHRSALATVKG